MQIQISWLLQKPTDLDLHCLKRQGISGFSRTRVKPHFYTVKLGFTGVYINFLISAQKHRLLVLVRTASKKYGNFLEFSSERFHFLDGKILNIFE